MSSFEDLVRMRTGIAATILSLQRGQITIRAKIAEYKMYIGQGKYDDEALAEQILRSREDLKRTDTVLDDEHRKLVKLDAALKANHQILKAHDVHPCQINATDHNWVVLRNHPSGAFAHRKCRDCDTKEWTGSMMPGE